MNYVIEIIERNKIKFALKRLSTTENARQETFLNLRKMNQLKKEVEVIHECADAGSEITPMKQISLPLRFLAKIIAKVIIYLLKFITDKQIQYNIDTLRVLDGLIEVNKASLMDCQKQLDDINARLGAVESKIKY